MKEENVKESKGGRGVDRRESEEEGVGGRGACWVVIAIHGMCLVLSTRSVRCAIRSELLP